MRKLMVLALQIGQRTVLVCALSTPGKRWEELGCHTSLGVTMKYVNFST